MRDVICVQTLFYTEMVFSATVQSVCVLFAPSNYQLDLIHKKQDPTLAMPIVAQLTGPTCHVGFRKDRVFCC